MTKKEKFLDLVSKEETNTFNRNKERIRNRKRLQESQAIALKVLKKIDELEWSQRRLAKELNVTPQQITKIVKGKENLTLETQVKLQEILKIPILATYYEKTAEKSIASVRISDSMTYFPSLSEVSEKSFSIKTKSIWMNYNVARDKYEFEPKSA